MLPILLGWRRRLWGRVTASPQAYHAVMRALSGA